MDRLISEQAVLDVINEAIRIGRFYSGKEQTIAEIKAIPSAEPKEGHWIRVDDSKLKCSECEVVHFIAQYPSAGQINYCPNCGARMESDGNERDSD